MPLIGNIGRKIASGARATGRAARVVGPRAARATGDGITMAGTSKGFLAATAIGAGAIGLASVAAPAARDASFDVFMGDPDADVAFTGRKMSARYLAGTQMPGAMGLATRMSSPEEYATFSAPIPTGKEAIAAGTVGTGIGAGIGFGLAFMGGGGKLAKTIGTAAGAMIGGVVGTGASTVATRNMMQDNKRFFAESPYRRSSSSIAGSTNAVGDIVLGMHNSRRGY